MFYCDECMKSRNWPSGILKSYGACEICDQVRNCNDVPSRAIPMPTADTPKPPRGTETFYGYISSTRIARLEVQKREYNAAGEALKNLFRCVKDVK